MEVKDLEKTERHRCYRCFRPRSLCFCDAIPRIDNQTHVLILQHVGERFHPFNTARIVQRALFRCDLIVGHNQRFGSYRLPIQTNAGLLYPDVNAPLLTELPHSELPDQLVIIDGTWHQAKTIVRDVPQLRDLPRYRLAPSSPSQYRIRREPNAQSLSTLEATVAAMRVLEPATTGLDQLLSAFDRMVESQLGHPANNQAIWRKKAERQSRPRHIPPALLQTADNLVVAYGEATPGRKGKRTVTPMPVNWIARRLGTEERFCCHIRQERPLAKNILRQLRLSETDFEDAANPVEFRQRWGQFVNANDVLIVYHQRTFQLLRNIEAVQPRCVALKPIFKTLRTGFRTMDDLVTIEGLAVRNLNCTSRATERLEKSVALAEHLRSYYGKVR